MKRRPLVALSSAAILAVYTAGYMRTRAAAERFTEPQEPRRSPVPQRTTAPQAPAVEARLAIHPPSSAPALVPRTPSAATPAPNASPTEPEATPPESPIVTGFDQQSVQGLQQAAVDAPPPEQVAARDQYRDGTYLGWGYCRHGDIQASVVVEDGRITSATIARCLTRYSCSWIDRLPGQVVSRQSPEVDYVSGATESTDAYHDAVADALSKAK